MRVGRLQRQARRCLMARFEACTADLAEWCWTRRVLVERLPITRYQRLSTARAAKSIGAVRVRREGRQWVWRLAADILSASDH